MTETQKLLADFKKSRSESAFRGLLMGTLNRRHKFLMVVVGSALLSGILFLFWPKQSNQPKVRIETVRRAVVEGKEMVFFRIVGADDKRIRISQVVTVSDNSVPPSSMKDVLEAVKAEESGRVLASILMTKPGRSFGERAPPGATVWKVRATVTAKLPAFKRFQLMPSAMLRMRRTAGSPLWKYIWDTWNGFFDSWVFDSEPITNSVPPEITK